MATITTISTLSRAEGLVKSSCCLQGGKECLEVGRNCSKCSKGAYSLEKPPRNNDIWLPVSLWGSPLTYESATKYLQKVRRNKCFIKLNTALQAYRYLGYTERTLTLSESDTAVELNLPFGKCLHTLMTQMRRELGCIGYAWVEHKPEPYSYLDHAGRSQQSAGHHNRHIITIGGEFIPKEWLERRWQSLYKSQTSGLSVIKEPSGYAFYLANYLMKGEEEFRKARFSNDWLFGSWFVWSKAYKRRYGHYPDYRLLAGMSELRSEHKKLVGYPLEVKVECLFELAGEVNIERKV